VTRVVVLLEAEGLSAQRALDFLAFALELSGEADSLPDPLRCSGSCVSIRA
jgi:hypothetical protein